VPVQSGNQRRQVFGSRRTFGDQRLYGLVIAVIHHTLMFLPQQASYHVAAHAAEPDHSDLHD
jgi:hypothetical protein